MNSISSQDERVREDAPREDRVQALADRMRTANWHLASSNDRNLRTKVQDELWDIHQDLKDLASEHLHIAQRLWRVHAPKDVVVPNYLSTEAQIDGPLRDEERPLEKPKNQREAGRGTPDRDSSMPSEPPDSLKPLGKRRRKLAKDVGGPDAERLGLGKARNSKFTIQDSIIPTSVSDRFLQTGRRFYYRSEARALAFEDKGTRLTTPHDDPSVVKSLINIAEARGWQTIRARGSVSFKREIWLEASRHNIDVEGYKPRPIDLARLDELQMEMRRPHIHHKSKIYRERQIPHAKVSKPTPDKGRPLSPAQETFVTALQKIMRDRGDSERAISMAGEIAKERLRSSRVYVGKVLDHGTGPYKGDADNAQSSFIKLSTIAGEKTIWGIDLPRAIKSAGITVGDDIALTQNGSKPVSVNSKLRNKDRLIVGDNDVLAIRNSWEIHRLDTIRSEARSKLESQQRPRNQQPILSVYDRNAPVSKEPHSHVVQSRSEKRERSR